MATIFKGNFTQQEAIPDPAIDAAIDVLKSGRLHRYNLSAGEKGEVALLEEEYATWQGRRYCLGLASGGQAIQIALRAAGVGPGTPVLTNAFTLAPVPGAIAAVGGKPVLVEINDDLRIDIDDLGAKAAASGARFLLLSLMRGHLCDMDRLMAVAAAHSLTVIEDCAHTMGAKWAGKRSGNFGIAGCFSTQTYKHMNSGEGGLLTSDDPEFAARAVMLSGSYMLYERNGAAPGPEHFSAARLDTPNMSARMDHLRAAILRPQLPLLEENAARWNARYEAAAKALGTCQAIRLPCRPAEESMVGSSIQFRVPGLAPERCERLIADTAARGVEIKWFGAPDPVGFTSAHPSWRYVEAQTLPETDRILADLFDMRLPLTFSVEDCRLIGAIIADVAGEMAT